MFWRLVRLRVACSALMQLLSNTSDEYDWRTLRAFLELFPVTALSRQLRAFMKFNGIALDEDEEESEPEKVQDADDADEETLIEEIIVRSSLLLCICFNTVFRMHSSKEHRQF